MSAKPNTRATLSCDLSHAHQRAGSRHPDARAFITDHNPPRSGGKLILVEVAEPSTSISFPSQKGFFADTRPSTPDSY